MQQPIYKEFDRSRLSLLSLAERRHDLDLKAIKSLQRPDRIGYPFSKVAQRLARAKHKATSAILMMGAHVIRAGVQNYIIDLMEKGYINCIAMNGAGVIHDYELALLGATTESVAAYIREGYFGFWKETGCINDIVNQAANRGMGLGEAMGAHIIAENLPHQAISLPAAGYRLGIPITVHVGMGYDIIHQFPNCDGAAIGATSYRDFLRFTGVMECLQDGVIMNFGSAVMAPEVYLKSLSMVRNAARQRSQRINRFTTLVCDLVDLPQDYHQEATPDMPAYYFRPWKTMLVRTVADGGESYYVRGRHAETIPQLWAAVMEQA